MKIQGYAYVSGDVSSDISLKGSKKPIYECIRHGALAISPELFVNSHHIGLLSAFAFTRDGSAKASWDRHGLRFEAALPNTTAGRDVLTALTDGLRLGVSIEFADGQHEIAADGVHELVSGNLKGISLTRPGFAYYSKPSVWLDNADLATLPADVRALRTKFLTPAAPVKARNRARDRVFDGGWYRIVRHG
jgi:hypothetical protein